MILTTVGTEPYPFNRLMSWLQVLVNRELIQEELIVQYGSCSVWPESKDCFADIPETELIQLGKDARLIIGHCDPHWLKCFDKTANPYILVPRAQCYKEHIDDRQIELASNLALAGVPIAWSPGDLVRFLHSPRRISRSTLMTVANETVKRSLKKGR
ncbi:glucosyl transferase [Roseofilum reptotaenium CS-1145]|uniref:Glucosyl transferase n=1 Tax=Roseofilum reptotaenium AO1-A TaxID=1925591 RepID=A0A1L9QUN4_9CYAN|nr:MULTISPECIES: glucosyl transferase [Roseofilum]MBP0026951.1 glucosyl transferase [Roseofilum sp. Guam]MDB9517670.1 glucosyl transferase [Roseofilum reptotaenium CS-1145]OJJ26374.1 hypothetical protein BI308_07120 [Roseofilum reptotaenium AO1-A]